MAPLYLQIERDIIAKIQRGDFVSDQPMPTEFARCAIYGVSRITVRRDPRRTPHTG